MAKAKAKEAEPKIEWRDRIKELRRVRAGDLLANPKNWRTHPAEQREAIVGVLEEVGQVDTILARETPEGLQIIDGHLRAELGEDVEWPVLILDVDEVEADIILASHDPIAAMAEQDHQLLSTLLSGPAADRERLDGLFDRLRGGIPIEFDGGRTVTDPLAEWGGMPEYKQTDKGAFRSVVVHFNDADAVEKFEKLLNVTLGEKARFLHYPELIIEKGSDKRWVGDGS